MVVLHALGQTSKSFIIDSYLATINQLKTNYEINFFASLVKVLAAISLIVLAICNYPSSYLIKSALVRTWSLSLDDYFGIAMDLARGQVFY